MSRRELVLVADGPIELRPGARPQAVRVSVVPEDRAAKPGPVAFVASFQIAELGVHVLAVERDGRGALAAVTTAGAYSVVLTPGDVLGSIL